MTVGPTVLAMTQRPTDEDESDLLSVSPAGQLIGVSASALIRYEAQGLIRSIRTPGGHRRYRRADVEALVAGGGQAADKSGPDPVSSAPDLQTGETDSRERLDRPAASVGQTS
jgi:hypothetical protein